jgi:hypothetical protein
MARIIRENPPMEEALRAWAEQRVGAVVSTALPVEASHRLFYRLRPARGGQSRSWVVMSSPPELENNAQFVALAELFAAHGVGVPRLHAVDAARGWMLMDDLGVTQFADVYAAGGAAAVLPAALDTLHRLQRIDDERIPPYTRQRFEDELGIYLEWFLGALLDRPPPAELEAVFAALIESTEAQPRCCVHRDFHARNLLLSADGGVGVVDFQDALMGPATYDLASLLRDCYHAFPETEVARWREAYLAGTPLPVNRERFPRDLDFVALQRQLKAVGIFVRLKLRDGRGSHLPHVLPVLARIGRLAAGYPELAALAAHVDAVLPVTRQRLAGLA